MDERLQQYKNLQLSLYVRHIMPIYTVSANQRDQVVSSARFVE